MMTILYILASITSKVYWTLSPILTTVEHIIGRNETETIYSTPRLFIVSICYVYISLDIQLTEIIYFKLANYNHA